MADIQLDNIGKEGREEERVEETRPAEEREQRRGIRRRPLSLKTRQIIMITRGLGIIRGYLPKAKRTQRMVKI